MTAAPLVAIVGPTAIGKSALAERLAEVLAPRLPVELISVDSALVYRGMDIGTAKPDRIARERVRYHLIDIRDPAEVFSAADFVRTATAAIAAVRARGALPLLVGGTMLYLKALRDGLAELPSASPAVRRRIEALAMEHGWPAVWARLKQVDAATAARLRPTDRQRLQRALEVFEVTGVPMSQWLAQQSAAAQDAPPMLQIGLWPEQRSVLHAVIERRLAGMFAAGLVDEVACLHGRGDLHAGLPAIKSVGYRQVWRFLDGEYGREEMAYRTLVATRQLAKRQLTWMRSWRGLRMLSVDPAQGALALAGPVLKMLRRGSIVTV